MRGRLWVASAHADSRACCSQPLSPSSLIFKFCILYFSVCDLYFHSVLIVFSILGSRGLTCLLESNTVSFITHLQILKFVHCILYFSLCALYFHLVLSVFLIIGSHRLACRVNQCLLHQSNHILHFQMGLKVLLK